MASTFKKEQVDPWHFTILTQSVQMLETGQIFVKSLHDPQENIFHFQFLGNNSTNKI